jgi:hypothetical protein
MTFNNQSLGNKMLFNKVTDRTRTQLAYKLNYYPAEHLPDKTKVDWLVSNRVRYFKKKDLLLLCDEDLTTITTKLGSPISYKINWAFSNIPTEQEWDKKSDGYIIRCEFRMTHVTGPVCILSFDLPAHQFCPD